MRTYGAAVKSNMYLYKKINLITISQLLSLGGTVLVIGYILFTNRFSLEESIQLYVEIMAIFLPFLISLLTYLALNEEEDSNYITLLNKATSRRKTYLGKLISLSITVSMAIVTNLTVVFIVFHNFYGFVNVRLLYGMGFFLIIGSLFIINFHLFINLALNSTTSILLGGLGIIGVAIIDTGLGDAIWRWVPWNWGSRLAALYYRNMLLVSDFMIILVAIFFLNLLSLFWFERWEGRRNED